MLEIDNNISLLKRVRLNNDIFAKEKLLKENSPLIKSVIKRYKDKGIEYDDLFQLGSLGFLKAINNFDETFGVKFSTYAVPMIAGEVKRYLRDNGILKVSRSTKMLNIKINKFIETYISEYEKSPCVDEISKQFNISNAEVVFAMESNQNPISIYSCVGESDSNQILLEKIEFCNMDKDMDLFLIYNILKTLPKRDRKIIMLRFFRDKTQKEIAEKLGVSQVQVSRLECKILSEIRSRVFEKKIN